MMRESFIQVSEIQEKTLENFSLENFEGPLDLLLFLIQKEELDITDVVLQRLTEQFAKKLEALGELDKSAQWLALTATLLLMKSERLIPGEEVEAEELPRIEVFQKLLEYCHFKEAASALAKQEEQQRYFFPRGTREKPKRQKLGIEEVELNELTSLLQDVMQRVKPASTILQEAWEVEPKIAALRRQLKGGTLPFEALFERARCKEEMIVIFLALLELMKLAQVQVFRDGGVYVKST